MALPPVIRRAGERLGIFGPVAMADSARPYADTPIREAAPQTDDAPPSIGSMVSRSGEMTWIPEAWQNAISGNPDTILARDGSGLALYDALLDDPLVFSALQQRRNAITSRDWEVAPGDPEDPRSVKAADDFRAMLKALGFDRVTGFLHYAVFYGYAVGEGIFEIRQHDGRPIVWLTDIVVPDRRFFGFTLKGELRFIPTVGASIEGEVLPDNKFVAIRTGGSHDFAFYGLGLGHWVYWPIFFKRAGLKFWALYLEKYGMPTVAIEYPASEKDDTGAKDARLAAAVAVGQDRAVLVPQDVLKDERLKLLEGTRSSSGGSGYKEFVDEQNDEVLRVVLGQPGTAKATPGGLGGDGQAKKDEGVKAEIVKADSDLLSEAFYQFSKWLTRWNHGEDVAAPTVYRVLDDEEDLNVTAERDVKLNGIGIKRTEESVSAVYGDGYEVDRLSEEDKAKQAAALAAVKGPPGAAPANDNRRAPKARVAAFAAEYGVEDKAPLYVRRDLIPSAEFKAWLREHIPTTVPLGSLHATVLYSKTPVDWFAIGEGWLSGGDDKGRLTVRPGGPRKLERLGDDGAVVLRFKSVDLEWRHESMVASGASHDFDEYRPHVTLTYDGADLDLAAIPAFEGELVFGPEIFEPIKERGFDPSMIGFSASEDEAIERLVDALVEESSPVFAAMAEEMRSSLQGVSTVEGARVAILGAMERMPSERLAKLTALPMLAERAAASIGRDEDIVG